MSKTFSPRKVDPSAWRTWHKDACRLMGRLGLAWILASCAGLPVLVWGLDQVAGRSTGYLLAIWAASIMGVILQPLLQHALDRAAAGHRASPLEDAAIATMEVVHQRRWFMGRALGQLVALVSVGVVGLVFSKVLPAAPRQPEFYDGMLTLQMFMIAVPNILCVGGIMGFHYFLRVRQGLETGMAWRLNEAGQRPNRKALRASTLIMMALYLLQVYLGAIALFTYPIVMWYHAALLRCAYCDIFEGGTGIQDQVKARAATQVPVLQA